MRLVPIHKPLRAAYGWYIDEVSFRALEAGIPQLRDLCGGINWSYRKPATVEHQGRFYAESQDFIIFVKLVYNVDD